MKGKISLVSITCWCLLKFPNPNSTPGKRKQTSYSSNVALFLRYNYWGGKPYHTDRGIHQQPQPYCVMKRTWTQRRVELFHLCSLLFWVLEHLVQLLLEILSTFINADVTFTQNLLQRLKYYGQTSTYVYHQNTCSKILTGCPTLKRTQ